MKMFLAGAAIAAIATTAVWAQPAPDHPGMRGPVTRTEVETKVKEHFAEIDTNKDGVVTKDEIVAYRAKQRTAMHDKMFATMDANKDGQISREEFDAPHQGGAMGGMGPMGSDQPGDGRPMGRKHGRGMHGGGAMMGGHGDMFATIDTNKDGKVTLQEATASALEKFDSADTNHDGTVTPDERRAAMKARMDQRRAKTS